MSRYRLTLLGLLVCACCSGARAGSGGLQLGVGAHYWRATSSLDSDDLDQSGTVWLLSGRFRMIPGLDLGLDVEQFPKGFADSSETLYAPAIFLLAGRGFYGGLGTGRYVTAGGKYSRKGFYVMRGGVQFAVLPSVVFDVHLNYRYDAWDSLSATARQISTDTLTLGTALRIAF